MPEAEQLAIQLYEDAAGRSRIRDYLDRLEARHRAKTPLRLLGFRARSGANQVPVLVEAFAKAEWKPRRKREILERAERLREEWLRRQEWGSA